MKRLGCICVGLALLLAPALSQSKDDPTIDPLLRVLVDKGILTAAEARSVEPSRLNPQQRRDLLGVLRDKQILSAEDYARLSGDAAVAASAPSAAPATQPQATESRMAPPKPESAPNVVAAIAPLRPLPLTVPKREGLVPAIRIGPSTFLKPYGFIKASVINDTSSPYGNDFPLPGFSSDSGPNGSPEFHVKSRFVRAGSDFEWLDSSKLWTITGRIEADFEGNFSRVSNRNISSIRSNALQLRLAWGRIDRALTDRTSVHLLAGQDWTPFGSSTLPFMEETTGLGEGFGTLYERLPQVRAGVVHSFGGARSLSIMPEVAAVMPAYGDLPTNLGDQLGFGERQGADSNRPELQARLVLQFQLDTAPKVPPAQIIGSVRYGRRTALVSAAGVPAAFKSAFPFGAEVSSTGRGYTIETQLPTRAFTLLTKYYSGEDLRFYFAGQLFSNFNDTLGLTSTASATSIDGASNVVFGLRNGTPVVAPQRPVRALGGFANLGLPVSRWFNANPKGRNAGWAIYLQYGYDYANARDVRRLNGGRAKSDVFIGDLQYKLNQYVSFIWEQSLYRTFAANHTVDATGGLPLFRGIPTFAWHDLRSEVGSVFTF